MSKKDLLLEIDYLNKQTSGATRVFGSIGGGVVVDTLALLRDGSRPMIGNLNLGGFNITSVNLVDGVDLPAHVNSSSGIHGISGSVVGTSDTQTLTNKTLTIPIISDFTSAQHGHSNAQSGGTISHTVLTNIGNNTHAQIDTHIGTSDIHVTHSGVSIIAGNGLSGGGDISVSRTLSITTPGTISVSSTNSSSGSHTHAITSSSDPGASSSLLSTNASGVVSLEKLTTSLIESKAGTSLTLSPLLDLILNPGSGIVRLNTGDAIQSNSYASQTTGWRITSLGEADFRYLFTDELHAKSFIVDLEQALAGGQIIAKSVAVLAENFALPAAGQIATLRVRDLPSAPNMAVFQSGDFIGMRQFSRSGGSLTISWAWGTVTSYSDGFGANENTQTWSFQRHSTIPGSASGTISIDSLAIDFGVSGNGFYEVNAIDGTNSINSPYAQIVTWQTHPSSQTVRTRFGNLRGITNVTNEFGFFSGNGTGVTNSYIRASSEALELRNVPLNLYNGTNLVTLLSAGASNNSPFFSMGNPLPTGILTGNGIWFGLDGGSYKFRVGSISSGSLASGIYWDGGTLTVKGSIQVQAGSTGIGSFGDAGSLATQNSVTWSTQVTGTDKPENNATVGAAWGTNLTGRPVELTDGRITTAISSTGVLQSRVDPSTSWGATPSVGAGLLLGSDYMGYWSGTSWKSYMDSSGRFYLNAGVSNNFLTWDNSTLTISGSINVTGGNAATISNITGAINLLRNSSFEENSGGLANYFYVYNNDLEAVPTTATIVTGEKSRYAQRISWTGTNIKTKGIISYPVLAEANKDYVLSFWARTSHSVVLSYYESPPYATTTGLYWPTSSSTWQFFAIKLRWSTTSSKNLFLSILYGSPITNGWIEFDNIMFSEGSDIMPWSLAESDKANTNLSNSSIGTLIDGASIRVGGGVKDSTLNGWNIDINEIVGQKNGIDQVVLNNNGHIICGSNAGITNRGVEIVRSSGSYKRALSFVSTVATGEIAASIDVYTDTNPIAPYIYNNILWIETFATTGKPNHSIIVNSQSITLPLTVATSLDAGDVGDGFKSLPFNTGWTNWADGYQACQYMKFGKIVFLRGLAKMVSGTSATIATLPASYRPVGGQVVNICSTSNGYNRVDITTAGLINVVGGVSTNMFVSLSIVFNAS